MDNVIEWIEDDEQKEPYDLQAVIDNIKIRAKENTAFCLTISYQSYEFLLGKINAEITIIKYKRHGKVEVRVRKPRT